MTLLLDDSVVNIDEWLAEEIQVAFAQQEGTAFVSGNGTNKPRARYRCAGAGPACARASGRALVRAARAGSSWRRRAGRADDDRGPAAALSTGGAAVTELSPSDLRHRLTLEELQCDEDEGGGFTESWVTVAELWADLRPSGGSEGVEVDRLAGRVTHDVSLCYRPGVRPSMRFRQGGGCSTF